MSAITSFEGLPRFDELSRPALRTRLFSVTPAGNGTQMVEGLLSILIRTSRAHGVNPRHLIGNVLAETDAKIGALNYAGFYRKLAKTVHGVGQYARCFVDALERATGNKDMHRLTLLPWGGLLPFNGQGMLASGRQWCPECLIAQHKEVGERYVSLAWSLAAFRYCPLHSRWLETRCPHCGKYQSFVPRYPDVGICTECGKFLVTDGILRGKCSAPPTDWDIWAANAILDMIKRQTLAAVVPTVSDFHEFVTTIVNGHTEGNRAAFCRKLGLPTRALHGWLTKGERPSMAQLLDFCFRLRISPASIWRTSDVDVKIVIPLEKGSAMRRQSCLRLPQERRAQLRNRLGLYLCSGDGKPVSQIAVDLDVSARCLRYWFPDVCAQLSERAKVVRKQRSTVYQSMQCDRVREIVQKLQEMRRNPSRRQVNSKLRREGMSLAQPHLLMAYRKSVGL